MEVEQQIVQDNQDQLEQAQQESDQKPAEETQSLPVSEMETTTTTTTMEVIEVSADASKLIELKEETSEAQHTAIIEEEDGTKPVMIKITPDVAHDVKPEVGMVNPWMVTCLDDFLFYCCPECDHKLPTKNQFINHAWDNHPQVRNHFTHVTLNVIHGIVIAVQRSPLLLGK